MGGGRKGQYPAGAAGRHRNGRLREVVNWFVYLPLTGMATWVARASHVPQFPGNVVSTFLSTSIHKERNACNLCEFSHR